jgi:hypothetical protein
MAQAGVKARKYVMECKYGKWSQTWVFTRKSEYATPRPKLPPLERPPCHRSGIPPAMIYVVVYHI